MRSKYKSWQNKNYGWNRRIIWYQDDSSIRLKMEDLNYGVHNMIFTRNADGILSAQTFFNNFRNGMSIAEIKLI